MGYIVYTSCRGEVINGGFGLVLDGSEVSPLIVVIAITYGRDAHTSIRSHA